MKYMVLKRYDTVYILKPELGEDVLLKIVDLHQGILVERGAKNIVVENKGRRHLKYPVKKFKEGVYIHIRYSASGEVVSLLEKYLKINEFVLRYLTLKIPEI